MVRVRVECFHVLCQENLYDALKANAKVVNVSMVIDSAGRDQPGYFVEFEGEPYVKPTD